MLRILGPLLSATILTGCGDANLNQILVSEKQKKAIDQILIEARYAYDKGDYDKALALSDKALAINPFGEDTLILRSYAYLSKAGLDGFALAKNLIEQSEEAKTAEPTSPTEDKDATSKNFSSLAGILDVGQDDFDAMGNRKTFPTIDLTYYEPKLASAAREGDSSIITAVNQAIAAICPLIPESGRSEDDDRHSCERAPEPVQSTGRSLFAWALSHLGEAITFYTVVLYDENGDGIPNLQAVTQNIPQGNPAQLLQRVAGVASAIDAIFPKGPNAGDSMLNAMFDNLDTTNSALEAAGVPKSVTDSISKSIENIQNRINRISGQTGTNNASVQNEALRNSLTTGIASNLKRRIETTPITNETDQKRVCCLYSSINSESAKPNNCPSITAEECAGLLASPSP